MTRHYHVLLGMPGCMPNANDMFTSRKQAESCLMARVGWAREEGYERNDNYRVRGNKRTGYAVSWGEGWVAGYTITIATCYDVDCREED